MESKIDVCVVTHNHAAYIERCVDSAITQNSRIPFSVLVFDDHSTKRGIIYPATKSTVGSASVDEGGNRTLQQRIDQRTGLPVSQAGIKSDSPRQVLWRIRDNYGIDVTISRENVGVCQARNTVAAKGKSEWIVFVDGDDYLHPDFLFEMWRAVHTAKADIAYPKVAIFSDDGISQHGTIQQHDYDFRALLRSNYIPATSLIRRSLFEDLGGFDLDMKDGFEDWELWIRAAGHGAEFCWAEKATLFYRHHDEARSHGANARFPQILKQIKAKHRPSFDKYLSPEIIDID